jgi:protein-S-isoprenylcysteine O-methyltransferase Ste14
MIRRLHLDFVAIYASARSSYCSSVWHRRLQVHCLIRPNGSRRDTPSMTGESVFRAIAITSIVLALPIGVYYRIRSQATRDKLARREEGIFIMIGLRLCGILAGIALAAYLINPSWMGWASVALPTWLRWIGGCLAVFAVPPLLFWTFHSLGKNLTDTVVTRREHALVTHGPYKWVRHPFYDVGFLWGLSLSLLIANWLIALLGLSACAMLVARTRIEEEKLIERFGDEYRAYMARTGRFLPRLTQ